MAAIEVLPHPDVLIEAEARVGEGPVIDQRTGRLCWVDILAGLIHETDRTMASLETIVGAIAPREHEPGFAVAVADGLGYWADGQLTLADPVLPEPHRRFNDAKCDSRGRLWAGSTHMEFVPGAGALHRWDGDAPSAIVATGYTLPNGLGWNEADTTMYLVDSMVNAVLRAAYDADAGEVGTFSPFCRVDSGLPDGLAVDADGAIWVAIWDGWEVQRYDSEGRLTATIPMPVSRPTSCAFGADGTLYITSAREGLSAQELASQPHAGSVFALATTTRGVPVRPFAG